MKQRGRLLVDKAMIAVVGTGNCREDGVFVHDPRRAAVFKGFLMAAERVCPRDAVMLFTDLPVLSWLPSV